MGAVKNKFWQDITHLLSDDPTFLRLKFVVVIYEVKEPTLSASGNLMSLGLSLQVSLATTISKYQARSRSVVDGRGSKVDGAQLSNLGWATPPVVVPCVNLRSSGTRFGREQRSDFIKLP